MVPFGRERLWLYIEMRKCDRGTVSCLCKVASALQREKENHRRQGVMTCRVESALGSGFDVWYVWASCLKAWRWAERGRHGHTSAYWAQKSGFSKKTWLKLGFGSWWCALLLLGRYFILWLCFSGQHRRTKGRSQLSSVLETEKIFGEEQCGLAYRDKPVDRHSCSFQFTSCTGLGEESSTQKPVWRGAALGKGFNSHRLSSLCCWAHSSLPELLNSASQCWAYLTNSFIGGVEQQLASMGRERSNLPLSKQMGSRQRCSRGFLFPFCVCVLGSPAQQVRGSGRNAIAPLLLQIAHLIKD